MRKTEQQKQDGEWLGSGFRPENFIPGIVIGFILGMFFDLSKPTSNQVNSRNKLSSGKLQSHNLVLKSGDQELKMVSSFFLFFSFKEIIILHIMN